MGEKIRRMLELIRLVVSTIQRVIKCGRREQQTRKSVTRMLSEVYRYWRYWRDDSAIGAYFEFELYKPQKSMDDVLAYVPERAHQKIQRLSRYREYDCTAFDKRYEYLMFKAMELPHPEVILFTFDGKITDDRFRSLNLATAMDRVMDSSVQRFFLKPAFSSGSKGSDVVSIADGRLRRMNGTMTDLAGIVEEARELPCGYVLQCEMRNQHPVMSELNPDSVNTLRIVTHYSGRGLAILRALLRVGRKGSCFDNSVAGGVFINVDTHSFETSGECYIEKPRITCLGQIHPDSGVRLNGIKIPFADEIRAILDKAAFVFSQPTFLGWDVAVTTDGPCLIEVQLGFDLDHHQVAAGRGLRDDLHYDPTKMHEQKNRWTEMGAYRKKLKDRKAETPRATS